MIKIKKFLVRPFPEKSESLLGYCCRLAIANFFDENELSNIIFGRTSDIRSRDQQKRKKLQTSLINLTDFENIGDLFNTREWHTEFKHLFEYKIQKVCISCLQEKPFIQALWDFKHYIVCHRHLEVLIDYCDICGDKYDCYSAVVQQCKNCGNKLRKREENLSHSLDSISNYLSEAEIFEKQNLSYTLTKLDLRLRKTVPFIHMLSESSTRKANRQRQQDPKTYVKLQAEADHLAMNKDDGAKALGNMIATSIDIQGISPAISSYSTYINDAKSDHFKTVLQESIEIHGSEFGNRQITVQFICKLWNMEEPKLLRALDQIDPNLRSGKKVVKCRDLSNKIGEIKNVYTILSNR